MVLYLHDYEDGNLENRLVKLYTDALLKFLDCSEDSVEMNITETI